MGPDIASAYYIADLVEDNAKVALFHRYKLSIGGRPRST